MIHSSVSWLSIWATPSCTRGQDTSIASLFRIHQCIISDVDFIRFTFTGFTP